MSGKFIFSPAEAPKVIRTLEDTPFFGNKDWIRPDLRDALRTAMATTILYVLLSDAEDPQTIESRVSSRPELITSAVALADQFFDVSSVRKLSETAALYYNMFADVFVIISFDNESNIPVVYAAAGESIAKSLELKSPNDLMELVIRHRPDTVLPIMMSVTEFDQLKKLFVVVAPVPDLKNPKRLELKSNFDDYFTQFGRIKSDQCLSAAKERYAQKEGEIAKSTPLWPIISKRPYAPAGYIRYKDVSTFAFTDTVLGRSSYVVALDRNDSCKVVFEFVNFVRF